MKLYQTSFLLFAVVFIVHAGNRDQLFNDGWRFRQGEFYYGAEHVDFDDSDWRTVDLPHDWSIEDVAETIDPEAEGPFSQMSPGRGSTGHVLGGTAWYRKKWALEPEDAGKQVYLRFDGVYMESEVYVNDRRMGHHANGYMPFNYDITSALNPPGQDNVIALCVQNIGHNSRWYSGSGIYRDVILSVVDPVHIDMEGVYVTASGITEEEAILNVEVCMNNKTNGESRILVETLVIDKRGKKRGSAETSLSILAAESQILHQKIQIKNPELWSPESPALYDVHVILKRNQKIVDETRTPFGIRTLAFSAEKGFLLNGIPMELKGACMHHDNGILGAAAFHRAEERRVEIMKANGYNAIRTSHNPPSTAFLNACDRLGMLVMNEAFDTWRWGKRLQGVHRFFDANWEKELEAFIKRDRNHPSVILWSIGNEIRERVKPEGLAIAKALKAKVNELDTTRLVTHAICGFWDNPGTTWDETPAAFEILDVGGYNYQAQHYESDHKTFPQRIMVGTESVAKEAYSYWQLVEKHPYVIGDFIWTGMDYLGEAGIGQSIYAEKHPEWIGGADWPWFNANCGDIDLIGHKKTQSWFRDVVWGRSAIEMAVHEPIPQGKSEKVTYWGWPREFRHWNWPGCEGKDLHVSVYSTCETVELFLNNQSLGKKQINTDSTIIASFQVPYASGTLKAIGYQKGKPADSCILTTTESASQIRLTGDSDFSAGREHVAFVQVEICDINAQRVPTASLPLSFIVEGPAELIAAGNARPDEMASFQQPFCKTFEGRALIVLRSTGKQGKVILKAGSPGLQSDEIVFSVKAK